jgi:hypothetical protein
MSFLGHEVVSLHGDKKNIELTFDWSAANADGGEGGGKMILRCLMEDFRGLDGEIIIPLT